MTLSKILINIFYFIKKIYLLLFNFMIGKQTRKLDRLFVHGATIVLFIFPYIYINLFLQLFTGEVAFTREHLIFMIAMLLMPVLFACGVKLMMILEQEMKW